MASSIGFFWEAESIVRASIYRVWQFLEALGGRKQPLVGLAIDFPTSQARELFQQLSSRDQRHSLRVLDSLQRWGHQDPELLTAALLHDIGKGKGKIRLWHRVAAVLLGRLSPSLLNRVSQRVPGGWRYPFYLLREHAREGAEMVEDAGCSPGVARLIRYHHTPGLGPQDEGLRALHEADRIS